MKHSFLIAILILMACPLASAHGQLNTRNRGGCLVIYLRGSTTTPSEDAFCDRLPVVKYANGKPFQTAYGWVPALLAYSFDQAERASCGFIGCATDKTQVTLFVIANGTPNAGIQPSPGRISMFFNTGLIDFIDAASRSYLADIQDSLDRKPLDRGYERWMANMRAAGGNTCDWHFSAPPIVGTDFMKVQTLAQGTYQVVFGHELAHYMSSDHAACGGNPPGLKREMSCDATSVRALLRLKDSTMMPMDVVAVFMALDSYSQIAGPAELGIFGGGENSATAQEYIASMPWHTRAQQVVDLWDRFCRSGADSKMCPADFDTLIIPARELAETKPPVACTP